MMMSNSHHVIKSHTGLHITPVTGTTRVSSCKQNLDTKFPPKHK